MTEEEWLACADPTPMLDFLRGRASDRKLRLFACACPRMIRPHSLSHDDWLVIGIGEWYADGTATPEQIEKARGLARDRQFGGLQLTVIDNIARAMLPVFTHEYLLWGKEQRFCPLLRDIFGNPFRLVSVSPSWRTSTVMALATGIYEDRAFDRMPILADALQDAGCENPDILNHCRSAVVHVRGCWVIDLLLGRA